MASRKSRKGPAKSARTAEPGGRPPQPVADDWRNILWLLPVLIVVATLVYQPAWRGTPLWDDGEHLTRPDLQNLVGLWRIWFELGATQQYYPVVHSAFWVFHQFWGDNTIGYHLTNIVLHACSAWLLAVLFRRARLPGAVLAAFLFALHPLQAESVAWMTELKNVLSGLFYLSAALAYLRFDRDRSPLHYGLAIGLFILALLSKTVTATLPAALLVLFWWQRGTITRRDVVPLTPFFALGIASGVATAWIERVYIGAEGAEFHLSLVERALVAGRAIWHYLATFVAPVRLNFNYLRWHIDTHAAWQYLFPLGALALAAALWMYRRRSRGPLAALLFFVGTLFPALGFVNVFPFRYAFVADHFQYLACIGLIALVSGGVTTLAARMRWRGMQPAVLGALILVPLALLTWFQAHSYASAEALWRHTLSLNPDSRLAHNNLGIILVDRPADVKEAVTHFQETLRLGEQHPEPGTLVDLDYGHIQCNLALALARGERLLEVDVPRRECLKRELNTPSELALKSEIAKSLGMQLVRRGDFDRGLAELDEAVRLQPGSDALNATLAEAQAMAGRTDDALTTLTRVVGMPGPHPQAQMTLGKVYAHENRVDDAVAAMRIALKDLSGTPAAYAHNDLGVLFAMNGRPKEAAAEFEAAIAADSTFATARENLAKTKSGKRD